MESMPKKTMFPLPIGLLLCFSLLLAACSSTSAPATGSGTPTVSSNALVKTAQVAVKGKVMTVLTDSAGGTLYYFSLDTASTAACRDTCASNWPIVKATNNTPTGGAGVTGKITVKNGGNGDQLQYNGHFLYSYSGNIIGYATSEGLDRDNGIWHVATPDLKPI